MTGKPPHRPSGKTGAQEWERKDPKYQHHAHSSERETDAKPFQDAVGARPAPGREGVSAHEEFQHPVAVDEETEEAPARSKGARKGAGARNP